nr:MAG TPA: Lipopolysaccharide assembly protein A domain [Caudoviricetes sp.]
MLGLLVVLSVVILGFIGGVIYISIMFHLRDIERERRREEIKKRKREEEDARIKEYLSKQEEKREPRMEDERHTTAQSDDDAKFNYWYANMNLNLDEGAVECGFNMLQLYFASVNGTSKPFKEKLNKILRLNRYYK